MLKRFMPTLFAAVLGLAAHAAHAAYPDRPITLVVPYTPGGLADVVARSVIDEVSRDLGQRVVVENRGGAGGKVGLDYVRRAPKDGYTLAAVVPALMVTMPLTDKDFGMEPLKDFEPISIAVDTFTVLVVGQQAAERGRTLSDFVSWAKSHSGKVDYATPGYGTSRHFDSVLLARALGIGQLTHVVYKGEAPALIDLSAGVFHFMLASQSAKAGVDSGRLVPIAVAARERVAAFPNVPTFREQGTDFVTNGWVGFVAPAGVPDDVLERLNAAFRRALKQPAVSASLNKMGYQVVGNTRQEFRQVIENDLRRYGELWRSGAIRIDK
ncbi:MAG: Bug family tripartite tricarboxylate transporter substrate binding protein [Burkholderiaceae bacterium]